MSSKRCLNEKDDLFCSCQCCCWLQSLTSDKKIVLRQVAQGVLCHYQNSLLESYDQLQWNPSPGGLLGRQADTFYWPYWHEHQMKRPRKGQSLEVNWWVVDPCLFKFEFNCGLNCTVILEYVIILRCIFVKTVIFIFSVSKNTNDLIPYQKRAKFLCIKTSVSHLCMYLIF